MAETEARSGNRSKRATVGQLPWRLGTGRMQTTSGHGPLDGKIIEVTDVRIVFTKISDRRHAVTVTRADGSTERVELESRSFLRHDLAHFAIELELPIRKGFWGCVAGGASLTGEGVAGSDAELAESLAGPIQTLFRTEAGPEAYLELLGASPPTTEIRDLAARVHERVRRLRGHWKATPYGSEMELVWPD